MNNTAAAKSRRRTSSSKIHHRCRQNCFIKKGLSSFLLPFITFLFLCAVVVIINININVNNVYYYYYNSNNDVSYDVEQHQTELYSYYDDDHHHNEDDGNNNPLLESWDDFHSKSNMMILHDKKLNSTGNIVPIGIAHHTGLLHRGVWIAILRPPPPPPPPPPATTTTNLAMMMMETLLLKRAPTLKTCPSAWGLVGEHSDAGESWETTARRALHEEVHLELPPPPPPPPPHPTSPPKRTVTTATTTSTTTSSALNTKNIVSSFSSNTNTYPYYQLINLLSQQNNASSLLVKSYYSNVHRYELQATAIFAIVIPRRISQQLKFDNEVAETQWIPINNVLNVYTCNDDIFDLLKEVQKRIIGTFLPSY